MTHRARKLHVCAVGFFVIGKENSFDTLDELQIGRACIAVVVGCAYFFIKSFKIDFCRSDGEIETLYKITGCILIGISR